MSEPPALVVVGGFLGAGKTSLILAAARLVESQGKRAAAILNDQGDDLVDTQLAREHGVTADQVTGGCFCCRLSDLLEAADRLEQYQPDVIFAEAVGSCTDLAATVIRPLLTEFSGRFRVAPLTVLIDPERAASPLDPDMEFLFLNQIAEADIVCCSKADSVWGVDPGTRLLSARTGEGVAEWLEDVLCGNTAAGSKRLEIDYTRYAEAEAALAWMNCRVGLHPVEPLSAPMAAGPLMDRLDQALTEAGIRIVHLKVIDETPEGYVKAALCANGGEPDVEGVLDASPSDRHELVLNLRAAGEPEVLKGLVERAVTELFGPVQWRAMQCFRPAPPKPERRA